MKYDFIPMTFSFFQVKLVLYILYCHDIRAFPFGRVFPFDVNYVLIPLEIACYLECGLETDLSHLTPSLPPPPACRLFP